MRGNFHQPLFSNMLMYISPSSSVVMRLIIIRKSSSEFMLPIRCNPSCIFHSLDICSTRSKSSSAITLYNACYVANIPNFPQDSFIKGCHTDDVYHLQISYGKLYPSSSLDVTFVPLLVSFFLCFSQLTSVDLQVLGLSSPYQYKS